MPLRTSNVEIEGTPYRISQVPWLDGVGVWRTLLRHGGRALVESLVTMSPDKRAAVLSGQDKAASLQIATRLFASMDDADLSSVIKGLGVGIQVRIGTSEAFECVLQAPDHFAGRYVHMLAVYMEAARINFAGF